MPESQLSCETASAVRMTLATSWQGGLAHSVLDSLLLDQCLETVHLPAHTTNIHIQNTGRRGH